MQRFRAVHQPRRGAAIVAVVMLLLVVNLVIVGMVLGGARDLDLAVLRMDTVRAAYAADSGIHLCLREVYTAADIDGDGGVGSVSDDANDLNDFSVNGATLHVSAATSGSATTFTSRGAASSSVRAASTLVQQLEGVAMIAYGSNGSGAIPKYRIWNGQSWGAQQQANNIGAEPFWVVLRPSPLNGDFAMAILDDDFDIEVQIWDGSSWGSVFQAANNAGEKSSRVFDLAYEQASGDLLLVYRLAGSPQLRYRTHNGAAWSSEGTLALTSGTIKWLKLVPRTGTDEIMIVGQSDHASNFTVSAVWDGAGFGNLSATAGASGYGAYHHADVAFEGVSGKVIFTYSQGSAAPGYRLLTGGSWTGDGSLPAVGGVTHWSRLVGDPVSNELLYASLDASNDINVNNWNGSSWGVNLEVEASTALNTRRAVDIAYEHGGNQALLAYDEGGNTLKFRTWDGTGWSTEQSGPNGGNAPIHTVQLRTGISDGEVLAAWMTDNAQIRSAAWDGTAFGAAGAISIASGSKVYEPFMMAVNEMTTPPPRVMSWRHVQP